MLSSLALCLFMDISNARIKAFYVETGAIIIFTIQQIIRCFGQSYKVRG